MRVGGQSTGNLEAALVTIRQGAGLEVGVFANAHIVEQLLRTLCNGSFFGLEAGRAENRAQQTRMGAHMAAHHHVFEGRHFGKQTDVLESTRNARLRHFVHGCGLIRLACQLKSAAVGRVQAGDHVEKRGLACAVGANQAIDLTALDGDAHIGEGLQTAKSLGNTRDIQDGVFVGCWIHVLLLHFVLSDLPCSGEGHSPRGRINMITIMAKATNN